MKPTCYVINTARGPIVDQAAIIDALRQKKIAGAALDVFGEGSAPPPPLPDDRDMAGGGCTPRFFRWCSAVFRWFLDELRHFLGAFSAIFRRFGMFLRVSWPVSTLLELERCLEVHSTTSSMSLRT